MTDIETELRCPNGPQRLFAKVLSDGEKPVITEYNWIELYCNDCKRIHNKKRGFEEIQRVLHRYDLAGTLMETEITYMNGEVLLTDN